ncbi:MAG: formate dehydrogenase accessory sulfurtransferase FdhD [Desulfatibacillaceae bacterium]|nr:formate dehydrogenase accessory sulfurtransferase FdhD [Desulfatibacillaceae bacterium]
MTRDSLKFSIIEHSAGGPGQKSIELACEQFLIVQVNNLPIWEVLCSPGREQELVAGLFACQGIALDGNTPVRVEHSDSTEQPTAFVTLKNPPACILPEPYSAPFALNPKKAQALKEEFFARQVLREQTRSTHAAAACDENYSILEMAEDISRSSALEKAVGAARLGGLQTTGPPMLMLSCRISREAVQRAIRAGVRMLLSVSRPSAQAVTLARRFNLTLGLVAPQGVVLAF